MTLDEPVRGDDRAIVEEAPEPPRAGGLAPFLWLVGLAVVFIGFSTPWLAADFGETHEGRNAAVWGLASRSIRTEGVAESRFGGRSRPDVSYANHPPLIIAETLTAELVAGEHRIVTRAPAWIGSLVVLGLLARLLLDAGLSRAATVAGIGVSFGSAMFLVYGSMLDTPVICLPFAVALLIAWQRVLQGRPWHPGVIGGLALLAVLAGWQSTALLGVCGVAALIATLRRRFPLGQLVAMGVGGAAGLVIVLSWVRWVYGSLEPLFGNAEYRRNSSSLAHSLSTQFHQLSDLAPWACVVGGIGLIVAVAQPRTRWLAVVSTAAVVGYGLVFHGAAEIHDYWNYGILVPLALGAACLAQLALDHVADADRRARLALVAAVPLGCVALTLTCPSDAEYALRNGLGTPRLAQAADEISPADGPALAYVSGGGARSPWIDYETGRAGLVLDDRDALYELGDRDPGFPVLLVIANKDEATIASLRDAAIRIEGPYALVPAGPAAEILRASPPG